MGDYASYALGMEIFMDVSLWIFRLHPRLIWIIQGLRGSRPGVPTLQALGHKCYASPTRLWPLPVDKKTCQDVVVEGELSSHCTW